MEIDTDVKSYNIAQSFNEEGVTAFALKNMRINRGINKLSVLIAPVVGGYYSVFVVLGHVCMVGAPLIGRDWSKSDIRHRRFFKRIYWRLGIFKNRSEGKG